MTMLKLLKWRLFNYEYCTKCHQMKRHKDNGIDYACVKCNTSKCDRNYMNIIERYKNNQTISVAKDKATRNFIEYLVTNYQQSNGLLFDKNTQTLLIDHDEKTIYRKYLNDITDRRINKIVHDDKIEVRDVITALTIFLLIVTIAYFIKELGN